MSNIGYATMSVIPSAKGFGAALTKSVAPEVAAAGKATGLGFGRALVGGIAGVAVAGVAVVGALGAIGKTFHDMSSTIRVTTGASGKALDGLVASAKNVGRGTAASFEDVGKTVAGLNQRLGLTGPVLETLSKQFLTAGRITKQSLDMNTITGSFSAFNIKGKDTTKALDDLFRVSQATGVGINELAAATAKGAPAFKQFGLSFSSSAALVGVLDKAGINSGKTIAALTIGLTKFAKAGKDPETALKATVAQIQSFTKNGQDAKAINLAASIFGTRGAAQFVAAVKSGKVNLDDMMKSSGAGKDTILKAGDAVSTFSGKWAKFKNNVLIAVEPLATRVFKAFGDGMQFMIDVGLPALESLGAAFTAKVMPALSRFGDFLSGTVFAGVKTFFTFLSGNPGNEGAGRFTSVALAAEKIRPVLTDVLNGAKVFFAFLFGDGAGVGAGKFTGVATAALDIKANLGKVATFITETVIPAITNFASAVAIPALIALGTYIVGTLVPNLVSLGFWMVDNNGKVAAVAAVIGTLLLPLLIKWGVESTISAAKSVLAWVSTQAGAVTSAAAQVAASYRIVGGWVASAAAAVASGAETVAIWLLYKVEAIKGAAVTVASHASMAAAWVASKVSAVAQAAATAAAWVASAIATSAAWVASTAQTIAGLARQAVAMLAQKAVMVAIAVGTGIWTAAQWLLNAALTANPIGIVIVAVGLLVAAVVLIATKTTWFQTIWKVMTDALSAAWQWMWNSILAPIIRFVLNGFASIVEGIGKMLTVLSNIPGFGWAKVAADKMNGAAEKARALANGVKDIPDKKTVTIGVSARFTSIGANYSSADAHSQGSKAVFAKGGHVRGNIKGVDSVPAMLMPDEFVITRNGSNLGEAMKHFGVRGMAKGGFVNNAPLLPPSLSSRMNSSFGSLVDGVDLQKLMVNAMGGSGGSGGAGGAARWSSLVIMALTMLGQSASWLPTVLHRINQESGGNPNAINLTDSNAKAGHPSQGLMQTIPGTFAAYAGPFRGRGITDPLASIYAGLNYALHRYGSLAALMRPGGYAGGTNSAAPGYAWVGERGPEIVRFKGGEQVIPNSQLGGGVGPITVQVMIDKKVLGTAIADVNNDDLRRNGVSAIR